jgi:hypothetical protein
VARPSYKSEKRKKELARQKKQEEKRQKRFSKTPGQEAGMPDQATLEGLGLVPPASAEADAAEDGEDDGTGPDEPAGSAERNPEGSGS